MDNDVNVEVLSSSDLADIFSQPVIDNALSIDDESAEETEKQITDGEIQESGGDKGEEKPPKQETGGSPNKYSSIATALREEGVFPNLTDEDIASVTDAASFKQMFIGQSDKRVNSQTKRVLDALNYGVKPTEIQMYERTLNTLFGIKEDALKDEENSNLRRELIKQDFEIRGYSPERVKKEVEKSFNSGSDIEDATDALESLKEFYHTRYEALRDNAKKAAESAANAHKEKMDKIKKDIDSKESAFGALPLTPQMKSKIWDVLTAPVYTDPNGVQYTELQKYEREHHDDFLKYVGAFYAMTNGFTDFTKVFKPAVQKAVKSGFEKLEDFLQGNSTAYSEGGMNLKGSRCSNTDYFSGNWKIDFTD